MVWHFAAIYGENWHKLQEIAIISTDHTVCTTMWKEGKRCGSWEYLEHPAWYSIQILLFLSLLHAWFPPILIGFPNGFGCCKISLNLIKVRFKGSLWVPMKILSPLLMQFYPNWLSLKGHHDAVYCSCIYKTKNYHLTFLSYSIQLRRPE